MRSAAGVSYERAQAAIDGAPDEETGDPRDHPATRCGAPTTPCSRAASARAARDPDARAQDRAERGGPDHFHHPAESLEAHRLIEEMMIQANVCAAETLEQKKTPLIYRVHDTPSQEKAWALADFLQTLGVKWDKGQPPTTHRFNRLLDEQREGENSDIVNEVVLRTQMQAHYNNENIGTSA
jgi:ribonuclease R